LAIGFSRGKPFPKEGEVPEDLMGYMGAIFASLTHFRNESVMSKWNHKIIRIPVDEFPSWNFEISRDDRLQLVKRGGDTLTQWLQSSSSGSRVLKRRLSI
jgi:hypothetical protein